MRDTKVLVFDIGSSKLRAMLASRGLNNTFVIKGYKEFEYDGFYQGEFLKPEKISLLFYPASPIYTPCKVMVFPLRHDSDGKTG